MTEQQQQIKDNLISLVKKGVKIIFSDGYDRCSKEMHKSGVNVREGEYQSKTTLMLVKEESLEEWAAAIQEAEQVEAQRVLEREHDYNSPNFYKAISSYINDLQ